MPDSYDTKAQEAISNRFTALISRFREQRINLMKKALDCKPSDQKVYDQLVRDAADSLGHMKSTNQFIIEKPGLSFDEMVTLCDLVDLYGYVAKVHDHTLEINFDFPSPQYALLPKFSAYLHEIDPNINITQTPPTSFRP